MEPRWISHRGREFTLRGSPSGSGGSSPPSAQAADLWLDEREQADRRCLSYVPLFGFDVAVLAAAYPQFRGSTLTPLPGIPRPPVGGHAADFASLASRIRLAPVIALSLPNAIPRRRWFMPQELVIRVCSGVNQRRRVIRSAITSGVSTLGS